MARNNTPNLGSIPTTTVLVNADTGEPIPLDDLSVNLSVGDVEIGAVELKDSVSSNRAAIDGSGRLSVDGSGVTQPVSASSLPLPTGAATSANQTTALSSLGSIVTNTSGIATTNTALAAIQAAVEGTVDVAVIGSVTVSGTVAATQSGGWSVSVSNFPATQAVTQSGTWNIATLTSITNPVSAVQSGAWSVGVTGSVAVTGTFYQVTQPVSIAAPVAVTGPLTDAELRATPVPVSGTVAVTQGGAFAVTTDGLTDAELRASDVGVTVPALELEQGDDGTSAVGPMVMGLVSDTPQPKSDGVLAPLSINGEGRLRVASVNVDFSAAWDGILTPWALDAWKMELPYV